ncbi:hypothetical protein Aduo_008685 [Ancylostoma duodenale]
MHMKIVPNQHIAKEQQQKLIGWNSVFEHCLHLCVSYLFLVPVSKYEDMQQPASWNLIFQNLVFHGLTYLSLPKEALVGRDGTAPTLTDSGTLRARQGCGRTRWDRRSTGCGRRIVPANGVKTLSDRNWKQPANHMLLILANSLRNEAISDARTS